MRLGWGERRLRFAWTSADATWRTRLGDLDGSAWRLVTFDAIVDHEASNRPYLPTDLFVTLRDTSGRTATVRAGLPHELDDPLVDDTGMGGTRVRARAAPG